MKLDRPYGQISAWAGLVRLLCRWPRLRPVAMRMAARLEGGEIFSPTLRAILQEHYGVHVGMHSYGACLDPGVMPPGTWVGNYCSLAVKMTVLRRNHPIDRISLHSFFFNRERAV